MTQMRIKTVLRDKKILRMNPGSQKRIRATTQKNLDRLVHMGKLLRIMGLDRKNRLAMLEGLWETDYHIWLCHDGHQHLVYLSKDETRPANLKIDAYPWQ
jgi:hypothetical protein